jgi:hypothetical protein
MAMWPNAVILHNILRLKLQKSLDSNTLHIRPFKSKNLSSPMTCLHLHTYSRKFATYAWIFVFAILSDLPENLQIVQFVHANWSLDIYMIDWLTVYGFTSRSRIFHLYGDVTITGEGLQNLGLCSALRAFEQGGITPAVTRGLGFSGLIRRTAQFSRLFRHTRGCGGSILTRILAGPYIRGTTIQDLRKAQVPGLRV